MVPLTTNIDCHNTRILSEPDVFIHTSDGTRIPAHSSILASVSPVLENFIDRPRKHQSIERIIQIHSISCDAIITFVGFLYSSRYAEDEMDRMNLDGVSLNTGDGDLSIGAEGKLKDSAKNMGSLLKFLTVIGKRLI